MKNIITDIRKVIATNNGEKRLFVSTVGPLCEKSEMESRAIRNNLAWKRKSGSLNKLHGSAKLDEG